MADEMPRECSCREFVTQCEHYNGRVLRFAVHPQSIVVTLEEEYGLHRGQGSTCHSIITAKREYDRYRVALMEEPRV